MSFVKSEHSPDAMIGSWLRDRRKALRLTQVDLAGRIGVTQPALSSWETGKAEPTTKQLDALIQVLGPLTRDESNVEFISPTVEVPANRTVFVEAMENSDGVGKLIAFEGNLAVIEYFE